ncbi:MgtC/SapB family protein [Alkaliphilus peptidifermentans]|uniref:Putative Mg2+ transporter-C (MgtC) family protein n=1 Tax=Alkaliphilus peptidifermentans DSM 18978 TaxID=1120976 RepID=A0A1G5HRK1_9FIRM|nr:MgtC/SapB family protein [Alkaliphilus peptidifermentans]SCY65638.1 putative Mg2+ transporter-C (MgtC) family protein [Alkaliphilus peptidifermentans DSM 18978]
MISIAELSIRLLLATVIGGIIGFEREMNNRPAGFRTHILVTLGSCLIMIISVYGFIGFGEGGYGGDPARLASQVVSGIGFLGAGTILREGSNIRGLTTAASLWMSGGIGLTIGIGFYSAALIATLLVLFSLIILPLFEMRLTRSKKYSAIKITGIDRPGLLGDISSILGHYNINIRNIHLQNISNKGEEKITILFHIRMPEDIELTKVHDELRKVTGVQQLAWDEKEVYLMKGALNR